MVGGADDPRGRDAFAGAVKDAMPELARTSRLADDGIQAMI
jgi:hypothetical protein